jgi:tetratricopeptide (TPR) repeat protein
MKNLLLIMFSFGISLLISCRSEAPYPEAMQQAERCILQYPDSALHYLALLDSSIQHEPQETRMYYGMLTTKARDKMYMEHTSDSLMKEVVRFYESYGDADKLMEACYYLGSVYRDMKDAPRAITAFQQATKAGENSRQYDVLGRIYGQMGTLFAYQSLYEDAMKSYKKAYTCYLMQKDDEGIVYSLRNQGRMHESLDYPDSAEYYHKVAYKKALEMKDQQIIDDISVELGHVYIDLGKPDSAKIVFLGIIGLKDDAIYLNGLGMIYQLTSQPDSARFYFLQALQEQRQSQSIYLKSAVNKSLAILEAEKGNYYSAFNYAQKSLELRDSIKKITRTEAIGKINALYNYQLTEKQNVRLIKDNKSKNRLLMGGTIFTVMVIYACFRYVKKQKRIVREQEKRLEDLKNEQYKNSQAYVLENEKEISKLELMQQTEGDEEKLASQIELLRVANQEILITQNKKYLLEIVLKESDIYQLFHQAPYRHDISIAAENWTELQEMIDKTYNGFTKQIYALYPKISEHELYICYLIKIHIQIRDIAKLLHRSTSAISNSRVRLYKKIYREEGKPELLDKFIIDL